MHLSTSGILHPLLLQAAGVLACIAGGVLALIVVTVCIGCSLLFFTAMLGLGALATFLLAVSGFATLVFCGSVLAAAAVIGAVASAAVCCVVLASGKPWERALELGFRCLGVKQYSTLLSWNKCWLHRITAQLSYVSIQTPGCPLASPASLVCCSCLSLAAVWVLGAWAVFALCQKTWTFASGFLKAKKEKLSGIEQPTASYNGDSASWTPEATKT